MPPIVIADEKHPPVPVYHYLLTFQLLWILARWSQEWRNWCDRKKLMDLIGSSDSHPCNVFYIFPWMYHIHPDTWSIIKCFAPPNHTRPVQAGFLAAEVLQLLPEQDWQNMAKHLAGWSSNSRSKKLQCHFITVFAELWPFCQLCLKKHEVIILKSLEFQGQNSRGPGVSCSAQPPLLGDGGKASSWHSVFNSGSRSLPDSCGFGVYTALPQNDHQQRWGFYHQKWRV